MTRKKFLPLIIAGLFVFVVMFSVAFVALEANHDCCGCHCKVCFQIYICENNLKSLSLSLLALSFCVWLYFESEKIFPSRKLRAVHTDLISLKVKLSD